MKMFIAIATLFFGSLAVSYAKEESSQVTLDVSPMHSTLKADQKQTTWIRVGLEGFQIKTEQKRAPVNLAIVLDKSGSMSGEKITQARRAGRYQRPADRDSCSSDLQQPDKASGHRSRDSGIGS
ncbi:MAG: hypothetical protein SGI77_02185 [Pirellulaceae bacterium]|nr:hypothetical protein [Pirellulaceae bacterium]